MANRYGLFHTAVSAILSLSAWLIASNASAAIVGSWQFDNSLVNDVLGGSSATLDGSFATSSYTNATINAGSATVLSFPKGVSLLDRIGIPNDTGGLISNFTVVMDFLFPSFPQSYSGFLETTLGGDGDYFVENNGSLELFPSPSSGAGAFAVNTWHRVGVSRDASSNISIYVDGTLVASGNGAGNPRDAAIQTSGLWLFTDPDNAGETSAGQVNSFALYDTVLSPEDMANLGGATARGIGGGAAAVPELSSVIVWFVLAGIGAAAYHRASEISA